MISNPWLRFPKNLLLLVLPFAKSANWSQHFVKSYENRRVVPHNQRLDGTKNWELLNQSPDRFSPRHSHATCIFKCPKDQSSLCIWLTGGYSEPHRTFDLEMENENSDVWWSMNGESWHQVKELYGDFRQGVGNWDAKIGGYVAPWYSRYGHSLNALDGDGDGVADAMVLCGGFNPMPSNDIWITKDGVTWNFDGYAPWPKRAYHGATVFQRKLWILGGTPLSNDVWRGQLMKESSRDAGYRIVWNQVMPNYAAPWAPRVGLCAVTQLYNEMTTSGLFKSEKLFVLGGFAGFQADHPYSDGIRTRNDVWVTSNGTFWEQLLSPSGKFMPWGGRAFHSCTTWHSLRDNSRWVAADSLLQPDKSDGVVKYSFPRIFITGGGFMGKIGREEVRSLQAYTDTWWSSDGSEWRKVNYEEGSRYQGNIYSTNEWSETTIKGKTVYLGKWGHTIEAFRSSEDLDKNGVISDKNVTLDICTNSEKISSKCKKIFQAENSIPSLFVIGGKLESGPMVNDVFISKHGIHCELDGVTCGRQGDCGPSSMGCICHSQNFSGEFCTETITVEQTSSASSIYDGILMMNTLAIAACIIDMGLIFHYS